MSIKDKWCNCTRLIARSDLGDFPVVEHHLSICKLLGLFKKVKLARSYKEHLRYLNEFIDASVDGIYINDLLHVARILQALFDTMNVAPFLKPYLEKLLDICAFELLLKDTSNELTGVVFIAEYMSLLGLLPLWFTEKEMRQKVYSIIFQLITCEKSRENTASLDLRHKAVQNSFLPEIFSQLIEAICLDELPDVLIIVWIMSDISVVVSQNIAKVNVTDYLLARLLPNLEDNESEDDYDSSECFPKPSKEYYGRVDLSFEILLNIIRSLEHADEKTLVDLTPTRKQMGIVQYIFREIIKADQKFIRNNILEYIILCLEIFPKFPYGDCYLADDVATLSVATELTFKHSWMTKVVFTDDKYDVAFKKMLLFSLSYIEKYPHIHLIYENQRVIPGLLAMLEPNYEYQWHKDDQKIIVKIILTLFYIILPKCLDQFIELRGPASLLIIIEFYTMYPDEVTQENMECTMRLLDKLLQLQIEEVTENLEHHEIQGVVALLFNYIIKKPSLKTSDYYHFEYCFCIMAHLKHKIVVDENLETEATFLDYIFKFFHRILNPTKTDSYFSPRSLIWAINCLWEIVNFDEEHLKSFLMNNGIYVLLDILEICPMSVQVIGLGFLVDLCDHGACIPYLLTWRSGKRKEQNFYSLLAKIFDRECKAIGTSLDENGIITDIDFPIMGKYQLEQTLGVNVDTTSNYALMDLKGSVRPKIYSILQILDTQHIDKVKFTNEYYNICTNMSIDKKHKVILHLAENYLALKLGEAWREIALKFKNSRLQPMKVDEHMLSLVIDKMKNWTTNVKKHQEQILRNEIQKEKYDEILYYEFLQNCRAHENINVTREMKLFAKSSKRWFLKAEKLRQMFDINTYLKPLHDPNCTRHKTFIDKVAITNVYDLNLNVKYMRKQEEELS